jgi:AraC-like DNA-binding protein
MRVTSPLTAQAFADLCRARALLRSPRTVAIPKAAAAARLSPFQFIRRFKALFGETPHQLRIAARIDHARRLLALTDRPVTDVCFDVGFSSLGSFSALFTRRVGRSPSAYRADIKATTTPAERPAVLYPGCLNLMGAAFATLEKQPPGVPEQTAPQETACVSS